MSPLSPPFVARCLRAIADESEDRFAREAFECAAELIESDGGAHFAEQALGLMGCKLHDLPLCWEELEGCR